MLAETNIISHTVGFFFLLLLLLQSFDPMLEALEKGQSVDLGSLPPPPGQGEDEKTDLTNIKMKKQN